MAAQKKRQTKKKNDRKKQQGKRSPIVSEVIFLVLLILAIIIAISLFGSGGIVGDGIRYVLFGLFGAVAYVFPLFLVGVGGIIYLVPDNEYKRNKPWYALGLFLSLCGIVQWMFNSDVKDVWETFSHSAANHSRGGFFGGLLSFELAKLLGRAGVFVLLLGLLLLFFILFSRKLIFSGMKDKVKKKKADHDEKVALRRASEEELKSRQMQVHTFDQSMRQEAEAHIKTPNPEYADNSELSPKLNPDDFKANKKSRKERRRHKEMKETATLESVKPELPETEQERVLQDIHIKGIHREEAAPESDIAEKELEAKFGKNSERERGRSSHSSSQINAPQTETPAARARDLSKSDTQAPSGDSIDGDASVSSADDMAAGVSFAAGELSRKGNEGLGAAAGVASKVDPETDRRSRSGQASSLADASQKADPAAGAGTSHDTPLERQSSRSEEYSDTTKSETDDRARAEIPYEFPSTDLLSKPKNSGHGASEKDLKATALKLKETLESFGVGVSLGDISVGPSVTRYELIPDQGVKVSRITALADDIKLSLAAADIRIEAPIPGKSAVGIEVPNANRVMITLRELLESEEFKKAKSKLTFAVGKDISGKTIVTDIAKMPHVLVAGSTGSGKSVLINTLIMSIIFKADPNDVKLIMVDPKMVEFMAFADIPHLMIPVVDDPKKASAALAWAVAEMEKRYRMFAELGIRDIAAYNHRVAKKKNDPEHPKMPQIVIIVDEFADLMMVASHDVEDSVMRLAQKARAAGIHLVLATQRPSVNVITGVIKANIPSRIALSVSSQVDSRTIIDTVGAEKLLGNGDMLFAPQSLPKPIRVQGAFVSDDDRDKVVGFLRNHGGAAYDEEVTASIETKQAEADKSNNDIPAPAFNNDRDEIFAEAGRFIIEKNKASIGALQRAFRLSFNRGARIMDQLADAGVVGPEAGTKPREIIMTMEQFEEFLASEDKS